MLIANSVHLWSVFWRIGLLRTVANNSAKMQLHCVSYTVESQYKSIFCVSNWKDTQWSNHSAVYDTPLSRQYAVYETPPSYHFGVYRIGHQGHLKEFMSATWQGKIQYTAKSIFHSRWYGTYLASCHSAVYVSYTANITFCKYLHEKN